VATRGGDQGHKHDQPMTHPRAHSSGSPFT
jgi:hypothetical protein